MRELISYSIIADEISLLKPLILKESENNRYSVNLDSGSEMAFAFSVYILFTHLLNESSFSSFSKEIIFYNRYYWFQKFVKLDETESGYDPALNQQIVKLLEEIEIQGLKVDWKIIQDISDLVEKESP